MPMRRITPILITGLLLAGCTASPPPVLPDPTTDTRPPRAEVDWTAYPANYQRIIDEDTTAGDCDALQNTFDAAPDDPALLTYIDEALKLADCY